MKRKKEEKEKLMTVKIEAKATRAFINGIIGVKEKKREENGGWVLKVSKKTGKWLIDRKIAKIVENSP